ncbi:MAG: type II secretion system F family protein [Hyphomicrobiaceae bacterium]
MDIRLLLLLLLILTLVGMLALAFMGPSASRNSARRLTDIQGRHNSSINSVEARMRRVISNRTTEKNQVLVSLIPNPENLAKRLQMTGRKWTLSQYMAVCVALAIAVLALMQLRGFSLLASVLVSITIGFGLPHKVVSRKIAKRVSKFNKYFPDALDLLVRGLRSGLPVSDTMGVVAREIDGPVGEEFRLITERVKIGKSMEQSMLETAERLGTPEFKFFCITLAIQRETGGNLAETLANLGGVLRQRAQMKLKIRAMSSESKASAYIIGCLPFLVFGLICWINYTYMSPFFTPDPDGLFGLGLMQLIGIGGMGWMSIGAYIMAQMVNFEI